MCGPRAGAITGPECLHVLETIFAFYDAARDGRARIVSCIRPFDLRFLTWHDGHHRLVPVGP